MKIEILADDEISEIVYDERNRCGELLRHYSKLLSAGVPLTGVMTDKYTKESRFIWNDSSAATHKALLINIEEIKPDSFEAIVRDYLNWYENSKLDAQELTSIKDRMKKLLGDKK